VKTRTFALLGGLGVLAVENPNSTAGKKLNRQGAECAKD
jgi:hypothetical protein